MAVDPIPAPLESNTMNRSLVLKEENGYICKYICMFVFMYVCAAGTKYIIIVKAEKEVRYFGNYLEITRYR